MCVRVHVCVCVCMCGNLYHSQDSVRLGASSFNLHRALANLTFCCICSIVFFVAVQSCDKGFPSGVKQSCQVSY